MMTTLTAKAQRRRGALIGCLLIAAVLIVDAGAAEQNQTQTSAQAPVQAIWKQQEINFYFQSFTTFYSCRSLADKVKRLLVALGASPDTRVRSNSCDGDEIARMPYLRIKVMSPVEATPAALAELEKTRSTRELTARVRGERAADASDQFPAQWKRVSLSRGHFDLEPGDCDLIDQLKRRILPKLAARIVRDDMQCTPNQLSLGQPRLEVEVLAEVPKPDEKAPRQEQESGKDGV